MIALYILLGVIALIALILSLNLKLKLKADGDRVKVTVGVGIFMFCIFPAKKKKVNFKKLSKKLKGKKLSEPSDKKHTSKKSKKEKTAKKSFFSEIINAADTKEILRAVLNTVKEVIIKFKGRVSVNIKSLKIGVDSKDAAKSAILCGTIWQTVAYITEFFNVNAKLKMSDGATNIYPTFNCGKNIYDIDACVKVRVLSVLKATVPPLFKTFIKLNKATNTSNKSIEK